MSNLDRQILEENHEEDDLPFESPKSEYGFDLGQSKVSKRTTNPFNATGSHFASPNKPMTKQ